MNIIMTDNWWTGARALGVSRVAFQTTGGDYGKETPSNLTIERAVRCK